MNTHSTTERTLIPLISAALCAGAAGLLGSLEVVVRMALSGSMEPAGHPFVVWGGYGLVGAAAGLVAGGLVAWLRPQTAVRPGRDGWRRVGRVVGLALGATMAVTGPHILLLEPLVAVDPVWRGAAVAVSIGLAAAVAMGSLLLTAPRGAAAVSPRRWISSLVGIVIVAVIGVALIPGGGDAAAGDRPNVVLVVIDTLRADRLSTYGYARPTAPETEALAARGVLFEQAATTASFTQPAMASVMTGRLPFEHGVRFHPGILRSRETTLGEMLRARGWVTGAVISNPVLSREWGYNQGFDYFDVVGESPWGKVGRMWLFRYLLERPRGERSGATVDRAISWLYRHRKRPFFLWVHLVDPHFPYDPPAPFRAQFRDGPTDELDELMHAYHRGDMTKGELAVKRRLSDQVLSQANDLYDGEVAAADHGVGRLLAEIDRLGLDDRTLTILTADHGESMGEHGVNFSHQFTVFEQVMHVPLVVAGWPGVAAGVRVPGQVSLVDLAPTLLDLLDLPRPENMRAGRSLAPYLLGTEAPEEMPSRAAYGENAPLLPGHRPSEALINNFDRIFVPGIEGKWRMVRQAPWKLIHIPGRPQGEDLLFRIDEDPAEEIDRVDEDTDTVRRLRAELDTYLAADNGSVEDTAVEVDDPETLEILRSLGYVD